MTQAVTVRRDGDTFQARVFWYRAARLLDPLSPVRMVGFEIGPKSFDDIWVDYDPDTAPPNQVGLPLQREHIQCKWHVAPDQYGYAHLVDPEFVNANARSLLQRAMDAQRAHAPVGQHVRFKLLTNWRIDRDDPLRTIVSARSSALRLDRLFDGSTDASKMGKMRKSWREHLKLDETALRSLSGTLAFGEATDSLDDLRDRLDTLFAAVGLRRIPASENAFLYDDLVFQWMAQGRQIFDRRSFRDACASERLLGSAEPEPTVFGVKSFEHPIDRLEERCHAVLDLVPSFDERYIQSVAEWTDRLYPEMLRFLMNAAKGALRIRLALDAHATLAFAAGSILDVNCGRVVALEQRSGSLAVGSADDGAVGNAMLISQIIDAAAGAPDIAVAIGVTHDIQAQVERFAKTNLPSVGRVVSIRSVAGAGARSIAGGQHAFELAGAMVATIRSANQPLAGTMHLFVAGPNSLTFFLGQRRKAIGPCVLYEYDFDGERGGSYRRSLALPLTPSTLGKIDQVISKENKRDPA